MGVDLKLLPIDSLRPEMSASFSVLDCERRRELWAAIESACAGREWDVPEGFSSHMGRVPDGSWKDERCYGVSMTTSYGLPLKYVPARVLVALADHEGVTDNAKNRAVWAYLAALPPDHPVALYWC